MITEVKRSEAYRKTVLSPVFSTASDLESLDDVLINQERAKKALELGLSIDKYGYNIYLSGQPSSRRKKYLKTILDEVSKDKKVPNDLCYVHNFNEENKHKPVLIEFAPGIGCEFKEDISNFAKQTKEDLINLFDSDVYKKEIRLAEEEYTTSYKLDIKKYTELIAEYGYILYFDEGIPIARKCNNRGKILTNKQLERYIQLNEEEYLQDLQDVNMLLVELAHSRAISHKNIQEEFKDFDKCKAEEIVEENFKEIKNKYIESAVDEKNRTKLDTYFDAIKEYIVENIEIFSEFQFEGTPQEYKMEEKMRFEEYFKLISVNLLVDNKDLKHAPVIFCDTIDDEFDLIGGVLYETDKRSFTTETDFSKIEAGDLLKANGGYLVVEAKDIILKDLWEDFKKSLTNRKVKLIGKNSTTVALSDTLEAEPINIDVKVILIGDLNLHYVLFEEDPMFEELFEIHAKFNDSIDRTPDNEVLYARLIKLICEEESLNVLSYDALCKTIEYSSKVVEKQSKLALSYSKIYKLLIEADKLSTLRGSDLIDIEDIEKAIENKIKRVDNASKYRDESIMDNITVLSVNDSKIGEVNALTVIDYSEYAIGSVSKLTANTYRNKKYSIVSSDKEGLLTGNIHDKALNIVTGFLGETFGKKEVFPYSINISFEQCYGGIEGDSATLAKTCAILSNLSKTPIKQCYGITGSMNQKGEAQCIGGVNEKIEGFFDLCKVKGLESGGGVIIPRANIKDLMLSEDVLEAIEKGKFTIYAVDNIEDAVKILTGKSFDSLCKTIKKTFEEK